jgi:hypothetical protein
MIGQRTAGKIVKAIYAAALAFLSGLSTVLTGSASFTAVTDGQWVVLTAWTLAAAGSVFGLAGWAGPRLNGSSSGEGR